MAKDLGIGAEHARLLVRDSMLVAERFDNLVGRPESVPGQGWEQVVLDLVVEAPVPVVGQRVGVDVACGEDLQPEEVDLHTLVQHRHALVIRCEHRGHIEAEQRLLDGEEDKPLPLPLILYTGN